jgi:hypothetical protein
MLHRRSWYVVLVAGAAAGVLIGSPAAAAGVLPVVVSPTSVDFGAVQIGTTASVSVVITATSDTQFSAIDGGTGNAAFTSSSNSCSSATLHKGETCRFVYTFTPPTLGLFTATASFRLEVASFYYDDYTIALTGSGARRIIPLPSGPLPTAVIGPASPTAPPTATPTSHTPPATTASNGTTAAGKAQDGTSPGAVPVAVPSQSTDADSSLATGRQGNPTTAQLVLVAVAGAMFGAVAIGLLAWKGRALAGVLVRAWASRR